VASSLLIAVHHGGERRLLRFAELPVTFGRGRDCEVCLDDPAVSRHHCRLLLAGAEVELVDLASANGTQLDGAEIERQVVRIGQRFLLGNTEVELVALPKAAPPSPAPEPEPTVEPEPPAPAPAPAAPAAPAVEPAPAPTAPAGPSSSWSGEELRGCQIFEPVGKGGFATVYRARQVSLDRDVAIKILDPKIAERPRAVAAFLQEARAAAALSHPNLVQVFDLGEEGGNYFSIMEFLPGGNLEQDLRDHGPLPWRDAARAACQCAMALEHARSKGLLHHDVKPGNLLLAADGSVKLADLGLAGALAEGGKTLSAGSPHYMAPERIRKRPLDARSDLYSLGCTLYRLLTGRHVFEIKGVKEILRAQCSEEPPPLAGGPGLPDVLASLVARLLRKDPEERPSHPGAVAQELERLLHSTGGGEKAAVAGAPPAAGAPRPAVGVSLPKATAATARERARERNKWKLIVGIPSTLLLAFFAFKGHVILLDWGESLRDGIGGEQPAETTEPDSPPRPPPPVVEPVLEGGALAPDPGEGGGTAVPAAAGDGGDPAPSPEEAAAALDDAGGSAAAPQPPDPTAGEGDGAGGALIQLPLPTAAQKAEIEQALADFRDPVAAGLDELEAERGLLAHGLPAARSILDELAVTNWTQPRSVELAARYHRMLTLLLPDEAAGVMHLAGVWKPTSASRRDAFARSALHNRGVAAAWHRITLGEVPLALR